MNRIGLIGLAALLAVSLGCASSSTAASDPSIRWIDTDQARQEKDVHAKGQDPATVRICEWEELTGSRIRQKVCRNMATNEDERTAARKMIMDLQQMSTHKGE